VKLGWITLGATAHQLAVQLTLGGISKPAFKDSMRSFEVESGSDGFITIGDLRPHSSYSARLVTTLGDGRVQYGLSVQFTLN